MFYPREPSHLEQLLEKFFAGRAAGLNATGIISPHAGYPYSGAVAGRAFAQIDPLFEGTFLVIGPSHRGFTTSISLVPWETPIGILDSDTVLGEACDVMVDELSHQAPENSLEVQMPFIKYRFPRARILPVLMGRQDIESAKDLAERILAGIRSVVANPHRDIRVIASSDFSHYIPAAIARQNDLYVIEALSNLDIEEFYRRIEGLSVSACGFGPVAAMCRICIGLGAKTGHLVQYATSGDVTGDTSEVVGYAALAVV
jgi:hypothetical protein